MKKYYVYELYNQMGTIEYVGETVNPKGRLKVHKCIAGKFHKRNDIRMYIVKDFDNRKDAYNYQCELQIQYGFVTDYKVRTKNLNRKGIPTNRKGVPRSEETKQKMRETIKAKNEIKRLQNSAFLKS